MLEAVTQTTRHRLIAFTCLVAFVISGCRKDSQQGGPEKPVEEKARPVRVIVIDDALFAESLERQWAARTETELQIRQMTVEQLEEASQLRGDIVIYPSECLGTLAHRRLIGVPSESVRDTNRQDVFDLQRSAEVRWGGNSYAFSFGSPQLVLVYRADLFSELGLQTPRTWGDYQGLVERLQRSKLGDLAPPEGRTWMPSCEPLANLWGAKTLLARAASYASHPSQFSVLFDYTTMDPLIAGPPFVRALEELSAATKLNPSDAEPATPETARHRVFGGTAAMALSWPSHTISGGVDPHMAEGIEIAFAELPGSTTAYNFGDEQWTTHEQDDPVHVPLLGVAGKLGSVAENARRPRDAAEILVLLTGPEWSELLSPASSNTTLFRQSHLSNPRRWTDSVLTLESSAHYAEIVRITQNRPVRVSSIRIPGWQRYLTSLDVAVQSALRGEKSAQDALNDTAQSWASITDELGVNSQREAYTRSLGLEP